MAAIGESGSTLEASPPSRTRLDRLTSPGGIFLLSVLIAAAFPLTSAVRDPDFWWHLRAGQLLWQKGSLLGSDPFTYTAAGHPWVMHEWLTELWFAGLVRIGGLGAVVAALTAVSFLGILAIAARAQLRRPRVLILGLGMALAVVAGYPIWGPRAQMITFAFTALTLLLIELYLSRGGRLIWVLPAIFVLWSNLHSGFVVGLGFLLAVVVAEYAGALINLPDGAPRQRIKQLLWVIVACTIASAINLNGPQIIAYPFATQGSVAQQTLIQEWHSPDFHDLVLRAFELMLVLLIVAVVVNRRIRARDAAIVAVGIVLALQSVRHVAIFIAAATPVLIYQVDLLWRRYGLRARSRHRRLPPLAFRLSVLLPLLLILGLLYYGLKLQPVLAANPASLTTAESWPLCAADYLSQAKSGLHLFNQYGEGGYLAYRLSGYGDKIYIFGDAALMGDDLLHRYQEITDVSPNWDAEIRRAGTDLVVFDRNTPLDVLLSHSRDWVQLYADPLSAIYAPLPLNPKLQLPAHPTVSPVCVRLQRQPQTAIGNNQ